MLRTELNAKIAELERQLAELKNNPPRTYAKVSIIKGNSAGTVRCILLDKPKPSIYEVQLLESIFGYPVNHILRVRDSDIL